MPLTDNTGHLMGDALTATMKLLQKKKTQGNLRLIRLRVKNAGNRREA